MTSNGEHVEMTSSDASEHGTILTSTVTIQGRRYKQRPLGPAPFASFEDLSDEHDSPPDTARVPLPGITEDPSSQLPSPNTSMPQVIDVSLTEKEEQCLKDSLTSSLDAPAPPRIDISRASSSSQHEDSITSSPERENGTHNLGYREDGTADLRSSTEELDYIREPGTVQELEERRKREKKMKRQQQVRDSDDTQSQYEFMERKDSSCSVMSEIVLLNISGRTSRISSIGSAASAGSAASGTSHLSAGSRRGSRSPSPHKMLFETSFCGSRSSLSHDQESAEVKKQSQGQENKIPSPSPTAVEKPVSKEPTKVEKKDKLQKSQAEVEVEIHQEKTTPQAASLKPEPIKKPKETVKVEKPKPTKYDLIKKADQPSGREKLTKPATKPKKIISIRDIPVDEIYIPLKGPELDLEEIIRNASPNLKKKEEKPTTSADEIYIPLHSPPKTDSPTGDLSKSSKTKSSSKQSSQVPEPDTISVFKEEKPKLKEWNKRKYEVCEDGSIIIPLHSPEDERSNNFEDEIRRVDEELQKAREAVERRLKLEDEEKQKKPATLSVSDYKSSQSRLSETYSPGKSDIPSGGSRTPSPGSSLSRKSSFASLFKKSDIFSSPDSQSSGTGRKKSGTFVDGLRERSHSRSKSKERQSQSSTSPRSPSGKKNVFTNLFSKKKPDVKVGKETKQLPPPRLDVQFTFPASSEKNQASDEGDYIIIPLRDPSDPPDSLDDITQEEPSSKPEDQVAEASPSTVDVEIDSTKPIEKVKDAVEEKIELIKSPKEEHIKREFEDLKLERLSESKISESLSPNKNQELESLAQAKITNQVSASSKYEVEEFDYEEKQSKPNGNYEEEKKIADIRLQQDSSVEIEEKSPKEENEAESDGRKVKLKAKSGDVEDDHETKGLVYQESFEDELPYVPTTLPLERPVGVHIVPVKHRVNEIKTCSIERPRSTTPINPNTLEDFISSKETVPVSSEEKMKISLPRDNSITSKSKSPTRLSKKGKPWFEFAETVQQSPKDGRKGSLRTTPSPPPLPPRSSPPSVLSSSAPATTTWINFEELPEKRKLPKRITTVPTLRSSAEGIEKATTSIGGGVVYSYVSPEDCQCECHDHKSSHSKETDHERGLKLKSNNEFFVKEKITDSKKEHEKSDCKKCGSGIQIPEEQDLEKKPLLDVDSDEEEEYFSEKNSAIKSGTNLEKNFHSEIYSPQEGLVEAECSQQIKSARPFEMDLEVISNHSSIEKDAWSSSDDIRQ